MANNLDTPTQTKSRSILQIMPADGWAAYCWIAETKSYGSLALIGWALVMDISNGVVSNTVVGLCASDDQSDEETPAEPVVFAEDLVNFRFYRQS